MPLLTLPIAINLSIGSGEFGPWDIPDGAEVITLRLRRQTALQPLFWTSSGIVVDAELLLSLDGGANYEFFCGMQSIGGIHTRRDLVQASQSTVSRPLPLRGGRKVKAVLRTAGGLLVSELEIDAT